MSRPGSVKGLPEGPPLGALDGFRSAQMMISAGDGPFLAGTPLWTFVASCRGAARRARGLARPRPVGVTAASWVWAGARGHACPAARRGRYRPKVERADRQRRGFPRAHRARLPARPVSSCPIPVRGTTPKTTRATGCPARSARP